MKIIVNEHRCILDRQPINEKEINVTKCEFEFVDSITENYVKEAYFTFNGKTYKQIIENNECSIPYEVLESVGEIEIGVVAYLIEDEECIKRYNPKSVFINTWNGSLKDKYENSEEITPTDKEQMEQALQKGLNDISEAIDSASNLDIDVNKIGKTTTVTITKQDSSTKEVEINDGQDGRDGIDGSDGVGLNYNWNGTSLGIKREDETNYTYTDLKGAKGDTGAKGADGKDGTNGQDGYTPVKGVDYFDGKDGVDGKDGTNGQDGADGYSPSASVSKSGSIATISITDKNGTTTTTVNDGQNGTNGQDGYTPVRGTDYWTASDISTIESYCDTYIDSKIGYVNQILATLTTPSGGDE